MERKVITIRRRTGNGLTRCAYCGNLGWDCMTYDLQKGNEDIACDLKPVCSSCLDEVRRFWLKRGYIVKERTIDV